MEPSESAFTRSESLSPPPHSHGEPSPLIRIAADEVLKVDHGAIRISDNVSRQIPIPHHRNFLCDDEVKSPLVVPDQINRKNRRTRSQR